MNKKKRKIDQAFDPDYEYVYGIVSTGTDRYFILHSTEVIYKDALKDDTELRKSEEIELLEGSEESATKKRRVEEIIKKKKKKSRKIGGISPQSLV
ncbi:hypothetical protein RhiirA1_407896 [Rhizophagus irregularis]|uniref:Uncharacterized protein n=1 Tax=Rhizophagus irregularis TaxID=588596 RepID=A0A2N0SIM4_9GLOM|nr:hypothetical protein RhiirA1_407896 [Rhizophagus irregularis]